MKHRMQIMQERLEYDLMTKRRRSILIWCIFQVLIFYADRVMVIGKFQKFVCNQFSNSSQITKI